MAHPSICLALPPALVPADAAVDLHHVTLPQREFPHVSSRKVVPGHRRANDPGSEHCWGQGAVTQLQEGSSQGWEALRLSWVSPTPGPVPSPVPTEEVRSAERLWKDTLAWLQGPLLSVGVGTGKPESSH